MKKETCTMAPADRSRDRQQVRSNGFRQQGGIMTISERKEREKEQRRMQILMAAENLFFAAGYDPVTMDQIARDAELSKGTLFFYFKNKESLFTAIVLRGIRLFHQAVIDAMNNGVSPTNQLRAMGIAVIRFSQENPGYLAAIRFFKSGRFSVASRTGEGEDLQEIFRLATELTGTMERIIRNGQLDGEIRADFEPAELAIMIRMMVSSLMEKNPEIEWSMKSHCIDEQHLVSQYLVLVESAIRGGGTPHSPGRLEGEP